MGVASDVVGEYFGCIRERRLEDIRKVIHADYTYRGADGEEAKGADAAIAIAEMYTTAFPDLEFEVEREIEAGDVVVLEFRAWGTHQGDLQGIAPTGRKVEVRVCNLMEVRDGKIVSEHEYFDQMSMMQQLGLIPAEQAA